MNIWREWKRRRLILDEALRLLSDGERRSGREIAGKLKERGFNVDKSSVNSVLFSEGRRYVSYDRNTYSYRIKSDPFTVSESPKYQNDGDSELLQLDASRVSMEKHYKFSTEFADSIAFFRTEARGGKTTIIINEEHPFSRKLAALALTSGAQPGVLRNKLIEARECIRLLLKAWSDYENEQPDGKRRLMVQEARIEWGRRLRDLLIG